MQVFDNDIIRSGAGLALSVVGLSSDGIFAAVAAIASALHAIFLLIALCVRLYNAIVKRVKKQTNSAEFIEEITDIAEDAATLENMLKKENNTDAP